MIAWVASSEPEQLQRRRIRKLGSKWRSNTQYWMLKTWLLKWRDVSRNYSRKVSLKGSNAISHPQNYTKVSVPIIIICKTSLASPLFVSFETFHYTCQSLFDSKCWPQGKRGRQHKRDKIMRRLQQKPNDDSWQLKRPTPSWMWINSTTY